MSTAKTMSPQDVLSKSYNFVIVGGGTAGLVLAARLTENPDVNVLVLEAGENRLNDLKINIPAFLNQLYEDPNYDWSSKSVVQPHLNNRIIAQPHGKVLGGSSAINFMMLSHGSEIDINNWEKLGSPGWNYANMIPYYRKSETYNPPDETTAESLGAKIIDPALHGATGPLQITFPHNTSQLDASWRPTLATLGLDAKEDPRKGQTLGVYSVLKLIDKNAKRSYSASAYYAPNIDRANLVVLTNAHVNKVLFENETGTSTPVASAVNFSVDGKSYTVNARSEIIVSAGAFHSAQILELSGIGSQTLLKELGVEVIVDNPNVGENVQDHILLPLLYEVNEGIPTRETIKQPGVLDWALNEWMEGRGGPLATGVSGTGFLSLSSVLPDSTRKQEIDIVEKELSSPSMVKINDKQFQLQKEVLFNDKEADLQISFGPTGWNPYSGDKMSKLFDHDDPGNYAGFVVHSTHPFSRGSIHITSADPKAQPIIDPKYLSHPVDLEVMANGVLFVQKLSETKPIADMFKDNPNGEGKKIQPVFKIDQKMDKERAVQLVKDASISSWHMIGACSMLPRADGGVVDNRLRVYGVKNLRVVDASIMPLHIRGNISSAVYAIAEKAADMIKEDSKLG